MSFQPAQSRYVLPSFVERTSYGVKESNPYNKLFEERIIFLGVQIDDASANDVMAQLLVLESTDPDRDILMYINSPGGLFTSLMAIYDTMQYVRPEISTVCLGQAASAAAVLLAAGTPGKRLAVPNARILIHQPATEGIYGQVSDLEIQAAEISRMRKLLEATLAKHSGRTPEQVRLDIERDKILTAARPRSTGSSTRSSRAASSRPSAERSAQVVHAFRCTYMRHPLRRCRGCGDTSRVALVQVMRVLQGRVGRVFRLGVGPGVHRCPVLADGRPLLGSAAPVVPDVAQDDLDDAGDRDGQQRAEDAGELDRRSGSRPAPSAGSASRCGRGSAAAAGGSPAAGRPRRRPPPRCRRAPSARTRRSPRPPRRASRRPAGSGRRSPRTGRSARRTARRMIFSTA